MYLNSKILYSELKDVYKNNDSNDIKSSKLLNINSNIGNNIVHVGINMKPCQYCVTHTGFHYHDLNKETKWNNFKNHHSGCAHCKNHPNGIHFHYK